LAEDLRWFEANRIRLLRRYRDRYVAIQRGRIIDHDRTSTRWPGGCSRGWALAPYACPRSRQRSAWCTCLRRGWRRRSGAGQPPPPLSPVGGRRVPGPRLVMRVRAP